MNSRFMKSCTGSVQLTVRLSMAFSVSGRTAPEVSAALAELKKRYEGIPRSPAPHRSSLCWMVDRAHTPRQRTDRYSDLSPDSTAPFGELSQTAEGYRAKVAHFDHSVSRC
jgi:hypothetical protein